MKNDPSAAPTTPQRVSPSRNPGMGGHVVAAYQSTIDRFVESVGALLILAVILCLSVCGWYYSREGRPQ
jgi:hypothetical protein